MRCRDGMCGGCENCLRLQGMWPDGPDEGEECRHPREYITRHHGGVGCNLCGEILQEPEESWGRDR